MDLVDEEDRARLERGQEGGDVALSLQRGAGGLHERDVELAGDDVRERGLAEPGRPGEQHVVERLSAPARRLDEEAELVLDLVLADEVLEPRRPQRAIELLLAGAASPGTWMLTLVRRGRPAHAAVHRLRAAQRGRDQLLRRRVIEPTSATGLEASPRPRPAS